MTTADREERERESDSEPLRSEKAKEGRDRREERSVYRDVRVCDDSRRQGEGVEGSRGLQVGEGKGGGGRMRRGSANLLWPS